MTPSEENAIVGGRLRNRSWIGDDPPRRNRITRGGVVVYGIEKRTRRIEDFFNAIVIQAAKDYVLAYKRYLKNPEDPALRARLRQQEAFFSSEAMRQYTKVDGEYLLTRLKDAVKSGKKLFPRRFAPPVMQENI